MSIKLKILRVQAGLTLEGLAQATELTKGYISKLERGLSEPSIGAALKLATALHVPVEEVFAKPSSTDPVVIRRAKPAPAHADRTPRIVSSALPDHKMVAFLLDPSDEPVRNHPMSDHKGEEILYVLKGQICLQLADRKDMLHAGDSAHFNANIPHRITSIGKQRASVLLVIMQET